MVGVKQLASLKLGLQIDMLFKIVDGICFNKVHFMQKLSKYGEFETEILGL